MIPPDLEDIKAAHEALVAFTKLPEIEMNDSERLVHFFIAGFYRGVNYKKLRHEENKSLKEK